jgi:hypothetical protein
MTSDTRSLDNFYLHTVTSVNISFCRHHKNVLNNGDSSLKRQFLSPVRTIFVSDLAV